MLALGVDIGTQSLKVVVVDASGDSLGTASESYAVDHPKPSWSEQPVERWEEALRAALPAALGEAGISADAVDAVGVSGQLDGCVAVDGAGKALSSCLIWMDRRAEDCLPSFDPESFRRRTGLVVDATHMAAKIRWLRRAGIPENARFHQPVSYLVEGLCGAYVFDHALASTTMLYDLDARDFADDLLEAFGVMRGQLPAIGEADSAAGRLSRQAARWSGLREGIVVAVGTGDDFATPLGAGIAAPGPMVSVLGTAEVVGSVASDLVIDEKALLETHAYPGGYFVENPGWLCGGAVAWARSLLGVKSDAEFDRLAAEVSPGCDGVLFLPALSGAMAPKWRAGARGAFYGMSAGHHAGHLARAVLEGCAFAMKDVRDRLLELGLAADPVVLLGGGARSDLWAQIRADLCDAVVEIPEELDTCAVGAARLALRALGASVSWQRPHGARRFWPRPAHTKTLAEAYRRYSQLFECLEPLY